jgi:hypothetical protein
MTPNNLPEWVDNLRESASPNWKPSTGKLIDALSIAIEALDYYYDVWGEDYERAKEALERIENLGKEK